MSSENLQLTLLLNQWIQGDKSIENDLINQVYPLLRDVAHKQLNKVRDMSFNTTVIVNELYLKLREQNRIEVQDKNHFLALSAGLIRKIIIDHIRANKALKRGIQYQHVTLNDEIDAISTDYIDWLTLDHVLKELEKVDSESVKLIELRFFVGLSLNEVAEVYKTSPSSISRRWHFAKSWLFNKLKDN